MSPGSSGVPRPACQQLPDQSGVGVKTQAAWNKIVRGKSDWTLQYLQRHDSSAVTGNIVTNLFLYFSVLR